MIKKPMKAPSTGATLQQLKDMKYPIACSAKLDGIRGVVTPDGVLSNSLKRLGNDYMQECLAYETLIGFDGELVVGLPYADPNVADDDVFNRTSGAIRRSSGEPDFKFYVFDDFSCKISTYQQRWLDNLAHYQSLDSYPHIVFLEQRICHTWQEALTYEEELLAIGYEGMMPRTFSGRYKEGRATNKEATILKRKPLAQSEGVVVAIYEQMKNNNEKSKNELGNSFRTSHKDNKTGKGTLGGVTLLDPIWGGVTFNCGTIIGGTIEWRQEMYNNPELIVGKTMTYVYQELGSIDKPRQPRAKSEFRDMTT